MLIERCSPFSGKTITKNIDITQAQLDAWRSGALIQDAFSHLNADDREFILTGITAEEWDEIFSDE